jgi:hypothetical protein
MRLVEEDAGIPPRRLLVTPVRKLRRDNRVNIGTNLRITQHVGGIADRFQFVFETLVTHFYSQPYVSIQ